MSYYLYRVYNIDWNLEDASSLPDEVIVQLSSWLVDADESDDEEWDEAVNEELESRFGHTAKGFAFQPSFD